MKPTTASRWLGVLLVLTGMACAGKTPTEPRRIIVQSAVGSLGTPYRWGGHTPQQGFDCSGLVFYAHHAAGIPVPRTARNQYRQGAAIGRDHLMPGDLVFFTIPDKKTRMHVGIYVGENRFIHAPGRGKEVTVSYLTNPYFKKTYAGARSFLTP